jgi:hypothetical protein
MEDRFIIESFSQSKSNCAAIALIKAAIIKYGIGKVVKTKRHNRQWLITMKDKQMVVLNDADINRINRDNKIGFRRHRGSQKRTFSKLKENVRLCFAVMVRNLQMNGYNGKEYTESAAIKLLAKEGIETDHLHSLLGLRRKTKSAWELSRRHLQLFQRKRGVLLYSDTHIAVVSRGYYDDFGKAVKIGAEIPVLKGRKANRWYELK